ncbi:MAG: phosphotransacetylase [Calditrichaeota bacterium]|nr:MAG: phosphotransacetylase [Calditrichota bacterium]
MAEAAMKTGVARKTIDLEQYREALQAKLGQARDFMRIMIHKARRKPKKIVYPEGENPYILKAARIVAEEGIARPILLGDREKIAALANQLNLELNGVEIIDPLNSLDLEPFVQDLYEMRWRKGWTLKDAREVLHDNNYLGCMLVHAGKADGLVSGVTKHYPDTIRPALQIIRTAREGGTIAGVYIMIIKDRAYFFADTTVNIEPTSEQLAEIALMTADFAREFDIEPRVAMLSFSNFGSARAPQSQKVAKAVQIARQKAPDLIIDGEIHADTAVVEKLLRVNYPKSLLARHGGANVLIFPNLDAGNISYKLVYSLDEKVEAIGPLLIGLKKPIHVLQFGTTDEREIAHVTAIAVVDAQIREKKNH